MASEKTPDSQQDATLAQVEGVGSELDLLKLSTNIDDELLDASLDGYQYA